MKRRWLVCSAVFALLGVLLYFVYTPMRFSGYLLLGVAAFCLLWGWLESRKEQKLARVVRRLLSLLLAVGLAVFAILESRIVSYGHTDHEKDVSAVVVLGAGVNGTVPSLSLRVRLDAALAYIEDKPEIPIVVTGSQGPGENISEARCMADWLIDRGVSAERIILEEQADNTEENIRFSKQMLAELGVDTTDNIAVVTADYHLYRASLYWSVPWMVPVAAHMPGAFLPLTINYYIREAFAVAKLLVFGQ